MAKGGNGNGNGGGKGNGKGGGQTPQISAQYAGWLRHYIPMQEGAPARTAGDRIIKNFGQRKFDPDIWSGGSLLGPFSIATLYNGSRCLAPYFDGAGDGLIFPASQGENVGKNFTVGAWTKAEAATPFNTIFRKRGANHNLYFRSAEPTTFVALLGFAVAGVFKSCLGATALPITWPMVSVIGTYDGATIKVYVNGRLDGSLAESGTPDEVLDQNLCLGHSLGTGGEYYRGNMAHPFILNRTLSHGEVLRLAHQGPAGLLVPDALFPPDAPEGSSPAPPSGGSGSISGGTGSKLGGVTNIGSTLLGGVIIGGHTPQDGGLH